MEKAKLGPTISRYGLIGGLLLSLIYLILTISGLSQNASITGSILSFILNLTVILVIIIGSIKHQKNNIQGGFITLGECVLVGTGALVLAGLIATVVSLVYTNFIDPSFMENILAAAEEKWEEAGLTDEQIEQARSMTMMIKNPVLGAAMALACYGIGGAIVSLIAGLIMKNEKPEFS